tara:strand:- start:476 stop:835 length:360 start_codon:yes stop_codon:yes gene_type:complete
MIIVTVIFIVLFAFTPCVLKKYADLNISILQSALISISGILTFITAGILMGEPVPPFPEWGVLTPYWAISLFAYIIFTATIYLAVRWKHFLKYCWLVFGYPVLFSAIMFLTEFIYLASI